VSVGLNGLADQEWRVSGHRFLIFWFDSLFRTRVLELYNEKIAENINKISEQEKHLTTAKEAA